MGETRKSMLVGLECVDVAAVENRLNSLGRRVIIACIVRSNTKQLFMI